MSQKAPKEPLARAASYTGIMVICAIALIAAPLLLFRVLSGGGGGEVFGQKLNPSVAAYDFQLTDHTGKPLRLSSLRGRVVLLSFGFTHCPDICPTTLSNLAKIYEVLPERDREKVQVVFVTVDPKRDTVEKLAQYVPFFNEAFLGATGSEAEVRKTAKEYGAFFEYAPLISRNAADSYTVNHSSYLYLIDPDGNFSILYDFQKLQESEKVAADIEKVLRGA
jgi:protein SCO1/2